MAYETILYEEDGPVGTLTLNRPDDGNMFTAVMCHEVRDCIDAIRRETRTRVLVLTGAGDRFFCIGGRKEGMEDTRLYAGVLPTRSSRYQVPNPASKLPIIGPTWRKIALSFAIVMSHMTCKTLPPPTA